MDMQFFSLDDPRRSMSESMIARPCTIPPFKAEEVMCYLESRGQHVESELFRRAMARDVAVSYLSKIGGAKPSGTVRLRPEFEVYARHSVVIKSFGRMYRLQVSAIECDDDGEIGVDRVRNAANSLPRESNDEPNQKGG